MASLNEKVKVIEAKERIKVLVQEIIMRLKCGRTQVYNTLKRKDKIMNKWLQGNSQKRRKTKVTSNEEINKVVWEWFTNTRSKNVDIFGPMGKSEALAVAKSLWNDQFEVSTGWLGRFKKRHSIVWN
jgi:centromere protein B